MNKKNTVKGFRHTYIDDEVDDKNKPDKPSIEEELVTLIFERYEPVETMPESTDQKSTIDLVDEMESSAEVSKNKVVMALKEYGFKLHYTGGEYLWLLKERKMSEP